MATRSKRIAAQALSRVQASKRGEVLVMKQMGYLDGQTRPSITSKDAYDSIFVDQLNPSHAEADLPRPTRGATEALRTRLIVDDGYVV